MKSIDKINMILLQKGISGAELSINAGLSNSAYSQWNTGKTKPSKKTLAKVAAALGVDITEIMDDDDLQTPYAYQAMQKAKYELAQEKAKKPVPTDGNGLSDSQRELIRILPTLTPGEVSVLLATARAQVANRKFQDGQE